MGKTTHNLINWMENKKHPHAHGEDAALPSYLLAHSETPPRSWGRPRGSTYNLPNAGNTPTLMGKTALVALLIAPSWKHPHAHGEDS